VNFDLNTEACQVTTLKLKTTIPEPPQGLPTIPLYNSWLALVDLTYFSARVKVYW